MNPKKGFSIKMIHRDSKESPLYPGDHLTQNERFQRLVEQSKAQAHYIKSQILLHGNAAHSMNPDVARVSVIYEARMFYVAKIALGKFPVERGQSPYKKYYLMIDSGSDLTWLQCEGAVVSFNQGNTPFYPHSESKTFRVVRFGEHPDCGVNNCNAQGDCFYQETYQAEAITSGYFAKEQFTLGFDTRSRERRTLFFGCGLNQTNFDRIFGDNQRRGKDDIIAGILGLGRGSRSFRNQMGDDGGAMSYCFQLFDADGVPSNTYLKFGTDAAFAPGQQTQTTPILQVGTSLYYLILEGISVGTTKAEIPINAFELDSRGNGGTIIDSGSPWSVMYKDYFDTVAGLVKEHLDSFPNIIYIGSRGALEVCYRELNGFDVSNYPSITLRFQNANYTISDYKANFVMVPDNQPGQIVCLGIARGEDPNGPAFILGAIQQANKRIKYDILNLSLSWATEIC